MRTVHPDPAIRRHGSHDVDSLEERRRDPAVRAEEAGVSHLREHADDSWVNRADDRTGSRDDAWLRGLGRQYHLRQHLAPASSEHQAARVRSPARPAGSNPRVETVGASNKGQPPSSELPKAPARPVSTGISAQTLSARVDAFLSSRGFRPAARRIHVHRAPADAQLEPVPADIPRDFICEDDVREALKSGKRLVVGDRTIVTPSARELGESNKVFVQAGWPH